MAENNEETCIEHRIGVLTQIFTQSWEQVRHHQDKRRGRIKYAAYRNGNLGIDRWSLPET